VKVVATGLSFEGYRGDRILDASFELGSGQCMVISGNSGCGKSMLHGIVCGLVPADSGVILFNDMTMAQMDSEEDARFRKKLGVAFQEPALISNLNIRENLHLPLIQHYPELSENERDELVENACQQFDLGSFLDDRVDELSHGIRSLVSFTRALVAGPELLIWDAPLAGIDLQWSKQIISVLKRMKAEKKTVILFSNKKQLVKEIADFHFYLVDGELKGSDEFCPIE
jgi:ABC-type multidrug transport system ATPase subunit